MQLQQRSHFQLLLIYLITVKPMLAGKLQQLNSRSLLYSWFCSLHILVHTVGTTSSLPGRADST